MNRSGLLRSVKSYACLRSYQQRASASKTDHLYGASCVIPALQAGKRRLKKLYVNDRGTGNSFAARIAREDHRAPAGAESSKPLLERAIELAHRREVSVVGIPGTRLDSLSDGRPNQGMVLAASPLEATQLRHLGAVEADDDGESSYKAVITKRESLQMTVSSRGGTRAFPIWLALDQVVDPQNLGAILRTAHFLDIDGVVLTEHETAPFSSTVSKASAGAMEVMDLFVTSSLPKFLEESAQHGWHVYGTDIHSPRTILISEYLREKHRQPDSVLALVSSPTIIVLGSEGKGMRPAVSKMCHNHLLLGDGDDSDETRGEAAQEAYRVDSLNVSVAAGILLHTLATC
ncbi:Alpha/beta knot methyltransferase [Geranomyces variabilis]|nr:Alpha/beta knot methyltransferase [Geranomyces variabilis]KAJ3137791.1 hypothetical protein HDU90_001742 [Geranomyces variabilis]